MSKRKGLLRIIERRLGGEILERRGSFREILGGARGG